MATYREQFEVAPDNTTLTTSNTICAVYTGTAAKSDSAFAAVGTYSALFASSAAVSQGRFDHTEVDDSYLRFYFRMDFLPAANLAICTLQNSAGTLCGDLQVGTTGALRLRNQASTLIDTTTATLAVDAWHRIELHLTNTRFEGRLFANPNYHSSTPTEDEVAWGGTVSNTGHGRTIVGVNLSSTNTVWIDDLAYSDVGWIGSAVAVARVPNLVMAPHRAP